ncbi:MAG: GntR family transcriptional regulator [Gammaproteobacteria bacterium]|nr:GntR family transcriptional regulator [Gammaproteobacteria bacterium]
MAMVSKIRKAANLRDQVTVRVRELLLQGRFHPGDRITEEQLAESLGVSRTPVREAMVQLAQQGMLEKRARGGYLVPTLSEAELDDFIHVRKILETAVAQDAVRHVTEADIASMRKILDKERGCLDSSDPSGFFLATTEFLSQMWAMSGSLGLVRCMEQVVRYYHFEIASQKALRDRGVRQRVLREHEKICHAIARRDAGAATEIVSAHLDYKHAELIKVLRRPE